MLDSEQIILEGLKSIIKNPDYELFPNCFIYPKTIEQNCILFIGINPSSSEDQISLDSYQLNQTGNYKYFRRFEEISEYCQTRWTHLDLLFFRETKQNTINNILQHQYGIGFIWNQLQIADQLIKKAEPKIVVVNNSLARTFLGFDKSGDKNTWLGYHFKFDFELGTYLWGKTPVFFSSMLTGQRALDKGSYERLKWQIRRALILLTKEELEKIRVEKYSPISENPKQISDLQNRERCLLKELENLEFKSNSIPTEQV